MNKAKVIMFLMILTTFVSIPLVKGNDSSSKDEANALFLEAVSTLNKIGGIGSLETPEGRPTFPQAKAPSLSPNQIDMMLKEAIQKLQKAIKSDPSLEEIYHFLGVAYMLAGDPDKAIEALEIAVEAEPRKETSYIYLNSLLLNNQKYDQAYAIAEKYLEEYPGKKIKGLKLVGLTYFFQGDYKNSIEKGQEIIDIDPENIDGHFLLANSYYMLGDKDKAEKEFRIIVELNPEMVQEIEKQKKQLRSLE